MRHLQRSAHNITPNGTITCFSSLHILRKYRPYPYIPRPVFEL